jgi:cytoskeletal protein RodZ
MKSIIKELIIVLLLILAILLVLGVLLYDYIPMNKVVPQIEQYEAPESIKEELEENVEETENSISPIVYEINESDLNLYEKSKDYQKGNVNPFADLNSTSTEENTSTDTNGSNTNSTGSTTNNNTSVDTNTTTNTTTGGTKTSTNTNSEGTFLPSTGIK